MTKEDFATHLHSATEAVLAFTRTQCWNSLSSEVEFIIRPDNLNENPTHLSEVEMQRFRNRKAEMPGRFSEPEVVERLWFEEQVPVWINIYVQKATSRKSTLELLFDRRFRQEATDVYHQSEGYPPFHVLVNASPYAFLYQREGKPTAKFNVNWQLWPWRIKLLAWRHWHRVINKFAH